MKRYTEYKDSGIEWIGEIPDKWEVVKVKKVVSAVKDGTHGTFKRVDNGKPLLSAKNVFESGIMVSDDESLISDTDYKNITSNGFPQKNDVLLCSVGTIGRSCLFTEEEPFAFQRSVMFLRPNQKTNPRYMLRYIQSVYFQQEMLSKANIAAQGGVYMGTVKEMVFLLPPILIQQAIADYLDQKTSIIECLIADKQKLIDLLKEKRQAIISEAVTKGLDKTANMKDSGIEWIGEIPEVWEVCKLKHIFADGEDGIKIGPFGSALKGKTLSEGSYKIYNQAHLIQNDFSIDRHFISEDTFNELSSYEVHPGDILFSMMGTIGKCRIMPAGFPPGIMDSHLLKAKLNNKCLPEYFEYVYDKDNSNIIIEQLLYYSKGSIMNGLNSSIIKNVYIPLPDIKTQRSIIGYLKTKITSIDTLQADITTQIEKLKEYRQSIISEAVTGKVAI